MKKLLVQGLLVVFLSLFLYSCSEENKPPTLVILATPASGNAPLSVQCLAEASDPDDNLLTFEWDFGDGSAKSFEQSPAHTFIDAGSFTATCTVTDNGSPRMSTSRTATITVSAPSPILSSLKPAWKVSHLPEFTLTVRGSNFIPSSKIVFNGVEKTVEFVSASEIHCRITPEDTNVFPANTLSSTENSIKVIKESALGVWVRNPSPGGDSQPLNFTVRSNHTFSAPELICSDFSESYSLLFNHYLYLIYRPDKFDNMKLMISKNNGKTWLPPMEIPYSSNDLSFSFAVDNSGTLYCINLETGSSYADIMLAKSANGGVTWTANRLICAGTQESGLCNHTVQNVNIIVLNDDSLHVTWMEHSIECGKESHNYYIRSTDHGLTWSERTKVPDTESGNTFYPILLGNGFETLHYISYIGGSFENPDGPYYQYSNDKGLIWSSPVRLNASYTLSQKVPYPDPKDNLYLPFFYTTHFGTSIGGQMSKDHGQSWNSLSIFGIYYSNDTCSDLSFIPDLGGNVNAFWSRSYGTGNMALYYTRKKNPVDDSDSWDPIPAPSITQEGYITGRNSYAIDKEGNLYIIMKSATNTNQLYFIRSDRDE